MKPWPEIISEDRRFWLKVYPRGDCWEWRGAKHPGNYGAFWFDRRLGRAHRYAYIQAKGSIPAGMQLDHLCHHPWCVRPSHLEAVTNRENCRRGWGRNQELHRQGRCLRGHPATKENIYFRKDRPGHRMCRACVRERMREYYREGRLAPRKRAPAKTLNSLGDILQAKGLVK